MSNIEKHNNGGVPAIPVSADLDGMIRVSQMLAKSDLVPKAYRHKPENVLLAGMAGIPFGWDPTMSMRSFHIIEGTPSLKPEIQLALVRQAGHSVTGEITPTGAIVSGTRNDTGDKMSVSFTLDDAKRANLLGKDNWKKYPQSMCWARALSQLCRMLFPDVVLGAGYTPEELGGEMEVTPVDGADLTIPAAQAKRSLIEALGGDIDAAKEAWGDRGANPVTHDELDELVAAGKALARDADIVDAEIVDDAADPVFDNPDWNETDPDGGEGVAA